MNLKLPKVIDNNFFKVLMSLIIIGFIIMGINTILIQSKIIGYVSIGCFTLVPILLVINEFQENKKQKVGSV